MRKLKLKTSKESIEGKPFKERYPYFSIELEHLPESRKWEVGKTYNIGLELKMTGINIREDIDGDRGDSSFEIRGIEPSSKGNKKTKLEETLKRFRK